MGLWLGKNQKEEVNWVPAPILSSLWWQLQRDQPSTTAAMISLLWHLDLHTISQNKPSLKLLLCLPHAPNIHALTIYLNTGSPFTPASYVVWESRGTFRTGRLDWGSTSDGVDLTLPCFLLASSTSCVWLRDDFSYSFSGFLQPRLPDSMDSNTLEP